MRLLVSDVKRIGNRTSSYYMSADVVSEIATLENGNYRRMDETDLRQMRAGLCTHLYGVGIECEQIVGL